MPSSQTSALKAVAWMAELFNNCSLSDRKELSRREMLICFAMFCVLLVAFPTEPGDDLLRHMKSYAFGYDYRLMYPFSPGLPGFNPWYPFDLVAGQMQIHFGSGGYILLQILATWIFGAGSFWLLKDATSTNLRFILTLVIVSVCMSRITLARPTTFESGLFLISLAACQDKRPKAWVHLLLGCLMGTYYLFWIYLIPLVAYRRIYLVPLALSLAGWAFYGGTEYFTVVPQLLTMTAHRGVEVAEATPIIYGLMGYAYFLIPLAFYWRKDKKRLLAVGWFMLSNQLRYLEVIMPIIISYAKYWEVRVSQIICLVIFIALCFMRSNTKMESSWRQLQEVVPANSKVLFVEMDAMFKGVYGNNHIQASPCMELGWDAKPLMMMIRESRQNGRLDPKFDLKPYDYLVESSLKEIPRGLTLERISGKYRIWKVSKVRVASGAPRRTS